MKKYLFLPVALLGIMTIASCSKESGTVNTDTNGGQANMTYELKATNTSIGTNQKSTASGTIVWTSGFANPTMVKFEAKQKGTEIEYKSTNTSQVDLFAPVALDFGGFILPAGTYKEIELKLRLDNDGTMPALQLAGSYTDNMGTIPLLLQVYDEMELKTEVKDVTIDNSTTVAAITDLDLASYTNGVTGAMIRAGMLTNGTLIITRDSNRTLYNMIVSNIRGKRHHCDYKHHH